MAELDAAESKKRKTAQFEMAKEVCLCFVSYERFFVIKVSNLNKQEVDVKDWTCLPPPNFDLDLELPEHDLCPFVFDSKIYLATSALPPILKDKEPVSLEDLKPWWPGWPVYEFKFEECCFGRAESLDDAPLPLYKSSIANTPGSGDVYFHMNLKRRVKDSSGFYVLSPGSRVWRPLMAAQAICDTHISNCLFVLDNNLFFESFNDKDSWLSRFDPIKESWTVEPSSPNNLSDFIIGRVIEDPPTLAFPPHISVSLPGLGSRNYTVCLTHEFKELPPDMTPLDKVLAILVNQQSGHVALYQYLDVCFQGIQPMLVECGRLIFVDLGNGKLCAILTGDSYLSDSETLCISVFTLSVDFTALQLDSGAPTPPMERDFLQVTVHSKSVYTMNRTRLANHIRHAFVWPPTKGGRFNHRTTRP